jgi:hypothetical protein
MYTKVKNKWQHDHKLKIFSNFPAKYRAAVISQCTAILIRHSLRDTNNGAVHISGWSEELRAVSGLRPGHACRTARCRQHE